MPIESCTTLSSLGDLRLLSSDKILQGDGFDKATTEEIKDGFESITPQSPYRVLLRDYPQCTGLPDCGRPSLPTTENGE